MNTPDLYGGSAVTTQNLIREEGKTSSTDVAGAATFSADVGTVYDILVGVDSNSGTAQPFGPLMKYTVPCQENPSVEYEVVDDALSTDLTATATDPDDGNIINNGADPVDIDAGQVKNIKLKWTGSFEEDFGNRWCEENEGVGNVVVVRYNTSTADNVYVTDVNGKKYAAANYQISKLLPSATGYSDVAFEFPVLRSNKDYEAYLVFDAGDNAYNEPTGTNSNISVYLFDVDWFINNDFTPAKFQCGIMDEDGSEVGAATPDFLPINITSD